MNNSHHVIPLLKTFQCFPSSLLVGLKVACEILYDLALGYLLDYLSDHFPQPHQASPPAVLSKPYNHAYK